MPAVMLTPTPLLKAIVLKKPIVLLEPARMSTPMALPSAPPPVASVPIRLPLTRVFETFVSIEMPLPTFPEITFRAPGKVPPIVFPSAPMVTAIPTLFGMAAAPLASVPMKLPSTELPDAPASEIKTPLPLFPEMTLPSPGAVPPMKLPGT